MAEPSCVPKEGEPVGGTYLGSLTLPHWDPTCWWWKWKVHAYYQSRDGGKLWEQIEGGKANPVSEVHTVKCPSPLAAVEFSPPPPPEPISTQLFGKNNNSQIIRATAPFELRPLQAGPGTKFAAINTDRFSVYIHFQKQDAGHENQIWEIKYANIPEGFQPQPDVGQGSLLVDNAAKAQPIAATVGKVSFWPLEFRDSLKTALLSKNLNATLGDHSFPLWNERWTVYHGKDDQLWFAETWDFNNPCEDVFTYRQPVNSVRPDTIYVASDGARSPVALVEINGRPAVYYLNRTGQIFRTIQTCGIWEPPVQIQCSEQCHPRRGTNISAVVNVDPLPGLPFCPWEHRVTISYQDSHGKINFCHDTILLWWPQK